MRYLRAAASAACEHRISGWRACAVDHPDLYVNKAAWCECTASGGPKVQQKVSNAPLVCTQLMCRLWACQLTHVKLSEYTVLPVGSTVMVGTRR